jgi:integrase
MATRKPNGASSIYKGRDGDWHGRVTVGVRDDGTPDRRHVQRKTHRAVIDAVRDLENGRDSGAVKKAGQRWTVEGWLTHWVENIAAGNVRENTLSGYRVAVYTHLNKGIGAHRLDKLQPEHLERLYARMRLNGKAAGTAHQVHRTARTALNEAVRRGHILRNPAKLAKAPQLDDHEIEPYTVDQVKRLLVEAGKRRNSARWAMALALGLRQGEALGLQWSDVDLDNGALTIRRARQRPKWKHGCGGTCGHEHGGYCPQRLPLRTETAATKSHAGRRTIGIPESLVRLLESHQREQQAERATAGQLWREGGWLFTTSTGEPINPRSDYDDWKKLLKNAGLRDGRLHDARHTAATVLLLLGTSERAVMGIMGWSNTAMAKNYQHMTDRVRSDVAKQVDALLWGLPAVTDDDDEDGPPRALRPA